MRGHALPMNLEGLPIHPERHGAGTVFMRTITICACALPMNDDIRPRDLGV